MAEYDNSIADGIRKALHDAQDLIRGEIALARAEMREEMRRVGAGVVALAAAAAAGVIGIVLLLIAASWGISAAFDWPVWAGFALVAAVVIVMAAVLAYIGRSRLTGQRHMPRTVDTMKENLEWMRARTS